MNQYVVVYALLGIISLGLCVWAGWDFRTHNQTDRRGPSGLLKLAIVVVIWGFLLSWFTKVGTNPMLRNFMFSDEPWFYDSCADSTEYPKIQFQDGTSIVIPTYREDN